MFCFMHPGCILDAENCLDGCILDAGKDIKQSLASKDGYWGLLPIASMLKTYNEVIDWFWGRAEEYIYVYICHA